jgi:hypothetical protein
MTSKTDEVLLGMLLENTGCHFLDSGGDSGRHWQQNQQRDIVNEPPSVLSFRYGDISVTHRVFHWLRERITCDDEATDAFDGPFRAQCDTEDDKSWSELRDAFPKWFAGWKSRADSEEPCPACGGDDDGDAADEGACEECSGTRIVFDDSIYQATGIYGEGEPLTMNTYNEENLLDQTLLFAYFELRSGGGRGGRINSYVVLQIHGGCDVRGGYTKPRVFVVEDDDELAIFDYRRASIYCELDREHYWMTDDGQHWYAEGACGRGAGAQLETYEKVRIEGSVAGDLSADHRWRRGSLCVDEDDHGFCPVCGGRLQASAR